LASLTNFSPSQGQANWFTHYHAEKIPSAVERYVNETKRCYGVLETRLKEEGTNYLVGGRLTIADIAFFPWVRLIDYTGIKMEETIKNDFPHVYKWFKNISESESVQKAYNITKQ
jgi:glutathione S-transferase